MSEKVVDIRTKKPHLSGDCICLHCGYEWVGVADIGTIALDCPECKLYKGVYCSVTCPDIIWTCQCGCRHFFITQEAAICAHCGLRQSFGSKNN